MVGLYRSLLAASKQGVHLVGSNACGIGCIDTAAAPEGMKAQRARISVAGNLLTAVKVDLTVTPPEGQLRKCINFCLV